MEGIWSLGELKYSEVPEGVNGTALYELVWLGGCDGKHSFTLELSWGVAIELMDVWGGCGEEWGEKSPLEHDATGKTVRSRTEPRSKGNNYKERGEGKGPSFKNGGDTVPAYGSS